ncbi:Hypothetical protein Cp262_2213 [Corynebacterium pseudotuberculosis]|nr:Hypothetical protein Cp262_2213 [Corynebacterium pseudotuberculosis]
MESGDRGRLVVGCDDQADKLKTFSSVKGASVMNAPFTIFS